MSDFERKSFRVGFGHERLTWSVRAVILLTTGLFAAQLIAEFALVAWTGQLSGPNILIHYFAFDGDAFLGGFIWTPITYMLLHAGLWHLFSNMLMLYFFGPDVERILGTRQFLGLYAFCGIVGVMTNLLPIVGPHLVLGASGAVLGVLAAFVIIDPERQVFLFPLPIPINARALVIIIIVINMLAAIGGGSGTSIATHFGGLAAGYLYMKSIPKLNAWREGRRQQTRGPSKDDMDKLGDEINNILRFKDHDSRK